MFDGINYGRVPLIPPYYYHPHAPAVGDCAALALAGAFAFSRRWGRLIGYQTYRLYLGSPSHYQDTPMPSPSALAGVGVWRRRLPGHATHVRARLWADPRNTVAATMGVRLVVSDATHTDTGDERTTDVTQPGAPTASSQSAPGAGASAPFIFDEGRLFDADLALSTVVLPAVCTITLEARLVTGGTAHRFRPFLAMAWYEVQD